MKFEKLLPKVKTDEALGKFYVENNRVPELVGVQAAVLGWLDYAAVGRQYREQEQGVFTHNGYSVATYEPEGEHSRVVIPALEKPGYVFRLTVDAEYLYAYKTNLRTYRSAPSLQFISFYCTQKIILSGKTHL